MEIEMMRAVGDAKDKVYRRLRTAKPSRFFLCLIMFDLGTFLVFRK